MSEECTQRKQKEITNQNEIVTTGNQLNRADACDYSLTDHSKMLICICQHLNENIQDLIKYIMNIAK